MDLIRINIFIGSLTGGGAERVVSELISKPIQNAEITLELCTDEINRYSSGCAKVLVLEKQLSQNKKSILSKITGGMTLFKIIMHYKNLKNNDIDVSVSFLKLENCVNMIVSKILGVPAVVSVRCNTNVCDTFETRKEYIVDNIINRLEGFLFRILSPYIIVNSEDNKNWLIEKHKLDNEKCICIYNPKDIKNIHALSHAPVTESFFNTDDLILLNVGRLTSQKGHIHLLRIFSELRKVTPCKLVICGVGELEESLKKLAIDLKINDLILFTGWTDNPYKYMQKADIFVFPSLYEGQPNAVIEALICGCPIVSADCDYGPREILDGGKYGVLTKKLDGKISDPINNPLTYAEKDMYNKLLYLLQNNDERIRLRKISAEQSLLFNKELMITKYCEVFRAAAEGKSINQI